MLSWKALEWNNILKSYNHLDRSPLSWLDDINPKRGWLQSLSPVNGPPVETPRPYPGLLYAVRIHKQDCHWWDQRLKGPR